MITIPSTLPDLLTWVAAGGGAALLAGVLLNFFLELFPQYATQVQANKNMITGILAVGLSILAQLIIGYAPAVVAAVSPIYIVLFTILTTAGVIVGATAFHAYRVKHNLVSYHARDEKVA